MTVPPKGANATNGTSPYNLSCPTGSYVTLFSVTLDTSFPLDPRSDPEGKKIGTVVVEVGPFNCSGTTTPVEGKLLSDREGTDSDSGSLFIVSSGVQQPVGYAGLAIEHGGSLIRALTVDTADPSASPSRFGGRGGDVVSTVQCPANHIITGVFGQASNDHVVTIGLHCRRRE